MVKPTRVFFGFAVLLVLLTAVPLSLAVSFRSSVYSLLKAPLLFSRNTAQFAKDLFFFKRNADENKTLRRALSQIKFDRFQRQELLQENARLSKLLDLKQTTPLNVQRVFFARVIGRSPSTWSRVFLIDKGTRQGVRDNMVVLSEFSLVGKVIEAGPTASKVLLMTDPNSKIGVLIQRTRQEGILFGTSPGECRMKYISVSAEVKKGDVIETAGFGGFFPKGLMVGTIERAWQEPGQIYQVALVRPFTDLNRIEEVAVVEI